MDGVPAQPALDVFLAARFRDHDACHACPPARSVGEWFDEVLGLLMPERSDRRYASSAELEGHWRELQARLAALVAVVKPPELAAADALAARFMAGLPELHGWIQEDVAAIDEGDPAATSRGEVARTYPGVLAIAAYRVAHALHGLAIPLLPRMLSGHAHAATGIDIHPAARIGRHFCIDHGTGVVIGATAVIGDRVKLYQGVTLGGLSVRKQDAAIKRHPTIEDDVVIYAGATILGGDTVIGRGSVIGGNVWLTRSVPAASRVTYRVGLQEAGVVNEVITVSGAA
jgi:serine O-acetyltransferase